jgi:SAM-dependent methyltransferase
MDENQIKKIIKDRYGSIAQENSNCCCASSSCCGSQVSAEEISKSIGYLKNEIDAAPEANLRLGCGNPIALSNIREGDIVLDLGSGAGFDAFLAVEKVGKNGKVIGVDMTEDMVTKAEANAEKYQYTNVEFRLGDIEQLPISDNSVDVIISNCVINLSPNKKKVFQEVYRVLKNTGKLYISDIVLLEELSFDQRNDPDLIAGCVGGAELKEVYLEFIKNAGFNVNVLSEDKEISKRQYNGMKLESIYIEAIKP